MESSRSLLAAHGVRELRLERRMRAPEIHTHEGGGQQIANRHLIPRERMQLTFGHHGGHTGDAELEDDEEQHEDDEHGRLFRRLVHDERGDDAAHDEHAVVKDRVDHDVHQQTIMRGIPEHAEERSSEEARREENAVPGDDIHDEEPGGYSCRADDSGNDSFAIRPVTFRHAWALVLGISRQYYHPSPRARRTVVRNTVSDLPRPCSVLSRQIARMVRQFSMRQTPSRALGALLIVAAIAACSKSGGSDDNYVVIPCNAPDAGEIAAA